VAKRKNANPWDEIFSRVQVHKRWKYLYPFRPNAADLDAVEKLVGHRLPASYRAFVEQFGLGGELAGWFRPDPLTNKTNDFFTVVGRTRTWREEFAEYLDNAQRVGKDFAEHLIGIGSNGGGDTYAFHPGEVTDKNHSECKVYELARLGSWKKLHGDTFALFIDNTAREGREWRLADDPDSAGPPGVISYWPGTLRPRLPFTKKEVATWLTANGGTAEQLCRTIRQDKHWDVLPILADALQEGGCDNKHLLQTCRFGNPQADGEWVLDVLENMGRRK